MKTTLTLSEIIDLAGFAGLPITAIPTDADELATEFTICGCPPEGVWNEGEPTDPNSRSYFRSVVYSTEYPEEGCMGLGPELPGPAAPTPPAAAQEDGK